MSKLKKHLENVLESHRAIKNSISINIFNINLTILPGVFNPVLTASTITTLRGLNKRKSILQNLNFLDVGCGSGILSIFAIINGLSEGTCIDISSNCIKNTELNINNHNLKDQIKIIESDIFDNIPFGNKFDVFLANLPLVNNVANDILEKAFFDENYVVLKKFFKDISMFAKPDALLFLNSASIMDNPLIVSLAKSSNFYLEEVDVFDEYIFDHYLLVFRHKVIN